MRESIEIFSWFSVENRRIGILPASLLSHWNVEASWKRLDQLYLQALPCFAIAKAMPSAYARAREPVRNRSLAAGHELALWLLPREESRLFELGPHIAALSPSIAHDLN